MKGRALVLGFGLAVLCGSAVAQLRAVAQVGGPVRLRLQPSPVVWIAEGAFSMGATDAEVAEAMQMCLDSRPVTIRVLVPETDGACAPRRFVAETPRRRVWLPAYGIDRTEVTHAAYRRCVLAGRCLPSRVRPDEPRLAAPEMPVTGVTWEEARAYCRFRGGRLPSEAEWERAGRGDHPERRFPWGNLFHTRLANHGRWPTGPRAEDGYALASPVGAFPDGASPHGLLDMAGNAFEWTSSAPRPTDAGTGADPRVYRVIRGGSWAQPPVLLRVTHRAWLPVSEHRADLGFRCAYDAESDSGAERGQRSGRSERAMPR